MLRKPETTTERIDALLMRADAYDPETGVKIAASRGRRCRHMVCT